MKSAIIIKTGLIMTEQELIDLVGKGETSTVQFKEKISHKDAIASEIVAFANSLGGTLLIGVKDKTKEIIGVDASSLYDYEMLFTNIATEQIKPQIFITTEVVSVDGKDVLVTHVPKGIAKPYKDNNGTVWVKQGSDKHKLTDNNELLLLFQENGSVYVDEMVVPGTSIDALDFAKIKDYLVLLGLEENEDITPEVLRDTGILKDELLTLGGLLCFGKNPQRYRPAFCIKAISYFGNDMAGLDYRDSEDITGTLPDMFKKTMGFFLRNLRHVQAGRSFNSVGKLEISEIALEEILQNALTHRDYTRNSSILCLIFDDRVEITSPGCLPNSLTVENIKMGNSVARNNLIVSYCSRLMKYRGIGSGILRAMKVQPNIEIINDKERELFRVVIPRVNDN